MKDALLIQQSDGVHAYLLSATLADHAAYCRRFDFDYWPIFGTALTGKDACRHAFWNKVSLLRKAVEAGYRYIVWLDSDCWIEDDRRDLRDACPEDGLGLVWHGKGEWVEGPECYDHWNCGAVYVGNGVQAERLLKQWWNSPDDGHCWHDQHAFNVHAVPGYEKLWRKPAPITKLGFEWNAVPFEPFAHERPVVAAWHGYSHLIEERLNAMQAYMQARKLRRMAEGASLEEACQKAEFCMQNGNLEGALRFFERVEALGEANTNVLRQKAACLYTMKRFAEAAGCYQRILETEPESAPIWQTLSSCYDYLGEHEKNGEAIREAERLAPMYSLVMHNKMLWQLRDGQWEAGFAKMNWQYLLRERIAQYPTPEWHGEPVKTLWVWSEQGIGDTIMLSRFLRETDFPCEKIVWQVQKPLVSLLQAQNWPGIEIVPAEPEKGVRWGFDAHIGMFSLPNLPVFRPYTPEKVCGKPYLVAPPEKVAEWSRLISNPDGALKIGFSWAGSAGHGNNIHRNLRADLFDEIVKTPGTDWYSLQWGIEIPNEVINDTPEVCFVGHACSNMAETAGIIANLDLVITVDSAIAHLAGAMGKPVWCLISKSSDWRWLLDREDTVWYDSVRLFRQKELGDWQEVMERVEAALQEKIAR